MGVLFVDCESTGLDPRVHVPWEVAIVEPDGTEHVWCYRPNRFVMDEADDEALKVGGFHERAPKRHHGAVELSCVQAIAELVEGNIIVGSKPSFDMEMLTPWLRSWGYEPGWHHRPVCVATMAYGWLSSAVQFGHDDRRATVGALTLPWKSDDLSRACGVEPPAEHERHTALGDARWVARLYRHLTGGDA